MATDLSWMGQRSTYNGPSLNEIKALEEKKQNAKQTLFITKLPESVTKIELRALFVSLGCTVVDCRIVYKQHKSTGVAYVDLAEEADVVKGLELNQTECQGSKIFVRRHVSREKLREIVSKKFSDDGGRKNSYNNRRVKEKSKNICFDYQKGNCKRGDSCRFQHNNNKSKKISTKKKKKMKKHDDNNNNKKNVLESQRKFGDRSEFNHKITNRNDNNKSTSSKRKMQDDQLDNKKVQHKKGKKK